MRAYILVVHILYVLWKVTDRVPSSDFCAEFNVKIAIKFKYMQTIKLAENMYLNLRNFVLCGKGFSGNEFGGQTKCHLIIIIS